MATPVIYRKFSDGDILALFPSIADSMRLSECLSYAHIGQHGMANYRLVVDSTSPAAPDEYASLEKELESLGYENLQVYRREQEWMREKRRETIREWRDLG